MSAPLARRPSEYIADCYSNGPNFMTPDPLRIGSNGRFVYELSQGSGFEHERIYGVTVLWIDADDTAQRRPDLSQFCHSRRQADEVIAGLGDLQLS